MAPVLRLSRLRVDLGISPTPKLASLSPKTRQISSISPRRGLGVCFHRLILHPFSNSAQCYVFRCTGRPSFDVSQSRAVSHGGSGGNSGGGDGGGRSSGGGAGDEGSGRDGSFLSWYLMALDKYPVVTKAITSAFLTLVGDLVCQLMVDRVLNLDLKRTFVFTFLGLVLVGPTLHFWYLNLSKMVTQQGASCAFLRLLLDQFLFSPIFIGVFLCSLVTLEGRPSQVVPKLQQEWFSSVLANWQLWIPFQFLNFQFVPQQFQVLAANVIALVWNVILSFKAHKEVVTK